MKPLIDLTGSNASLTLFGVDTSDGLTALGYHADKPLRAGRVFTFEGTRYRLADKLAPGIKAVGLPGKAALERPVRLEEA